MSTRPPGVSPQTFQTRIDGLGSRRVLWSSFGFSLAIHAALLLGAGFIIRLAPAAVAALSSPAVPDVGVEVVWILGGSPPPPAEPARPDEPAAVGPIGAPQIIVVRPSLGDADGGVDFVVPNFSGPGRPGATPAERLQPGLTDERLWAPLPEAFRTLTPEQREEILIAGRFGEWNDSIAAAGAAAAAWTDWTVTDGDGDRWGISDGQLHLGGLTLPLPVTFEAPVGQRDYMRQFAEIQRQGASALVQQNVRERQEAIRARRDRERAEAQSPDTIRTPR